MPTPGRSFLMIDSTRGPCIGRKPTFSRKGGPSVASYGIRTLVHSRFFGDIKLGSCLEWGSSQPS